MSLNVSKGYTDGQERARVLLTSSVPIVAGELGGERRVPTMHIALIEETEAQWLALFLEHEKHSVTLYQASDTALEIADDVNLIIVNMDFGDGIAIIKGLQARWPGLPTILASVYSIDTVRAPLAFWPEVTYLQKPFSLFQIKEYIDQLSRR
jgi:DNA-binding response OmpR family regulator